MGLNVIDSNKFQTYEELGNTLTSLSTATQYQDLKSTSVASRIHEVLIQNKQLIQQLRNQQSSECLVLLKQIRENHEKYRIEEQIPLLTNSFQRDQTPNQKTEQLRRKVVRYALNKTIGEKLTEIELKELAKVKEHLQTEEYRKATGYHTHMAFQKDLNQTIQELHSKTQRSAQPTEAALIQLEKDVKIEPNPEAIKECCTIL